MRYFTGTIVSFLVILTSCGTQNTLSTPESDITTQNNSGVIITETQKDNEIPSLSAFPDISFRGIGTEPFWSFTYSEQEFNWSEPGEDEIIETVHFTQQVYLETENTYYITGDFIALVITQETCSDGMSDTIYEYTVIWNYFDKELNGCAEVL